MYQIEGTTFLQVIREGGESPPYIRLSFRAHTSERLGMHGWLCTTCLNERLALAQNMLNAWARAQTDPPWRGGGLFYHSFVLSL